MMLKLIKKFEGRKAKFAADLRRLVGRNGVPRKPEEDFSMAVPFGYESKRETDFRIAAVCHIYFTDLARVMLSDLKNIPFPCDIYISTDSEEKRKILSEVYSEWKSGSVEIRIAENRGRDIGPKLVTFSDIYTKYDLIVFAHSKKTPHAGSGQDWRKFLMRNLLGSPKIVSNIVDVFALIPSVGMVVSQHYEPIREGGWLDWTGNYKLAHRLARQMGFVVESNAVLDFPSGSMFWARAAALAPLLKLNLATEDFPIERGQWDKTNAHAIERLFLFVCECAGYSWIKVAEPNQFTDRGTIKPIESELALREFIKTHTIHLLGADVLKTR